MIMVFPKLGKYEQVFLLLLLIIVVFSKCIAPYFKKAEVPLPVAPLPVSSPATSVSESETTVPVAGKSSASSQIPRVASVIPTDQEIAVAIEDQKQKGERLETVMADRSQRIEKVRAAVKTYKETPVNPAETSQNSDEAKASLDKKTAANVELKDMDPGHGYYMH
jgi:hypothetical protein